MKFSQNGWTFSDEDNSCSSANWNCKIKNVKARVFLAIHENGKKSFVIFNQDGQPVYEDTSLDGIGCHIDMMALAQEIK